MKVTLPVVFLALCVPSVAVASKTSSGRLGGGAAKVQTSIQAEKVTANEAAAAKSPVARSLQFTVPTVCELFFRVVKIVMCYFAR